SPKDVRLLQGDGLLRSDRSNSPERRSLEGRRLRPCAARAVRRAGRSVRSVQKDRLRTRQAGCARRRQPRGDRRGCGGARAAEGGRPMIRINLLTVERERSKTKSRSAGGGGLSFGLAQQLTLACTVILVVTGLYIGWRYLSLTRE